MIYKEFQLCVTNNGRRSEFFVQSRGTHQGSALSGPLFLLCAEILAHNIKSSPEIQGIRIKENDNKEVILQYADDTHLWSLFQERSVNAIIDELERFYKSTGLRANFEKSVIHRVGSLRGSTKRLKIKQPFRWSNDDINVLGIVIAIDNINNPEELNYPEIVEKANGILNAWRPRRLSLLGRIEVVNSLIASLFIYKMQALPLMSKVLECKLKKPITDFIWSGRKLKIRYENLTLEKERGGRKLVNIAARDKSMKIEWVKRLDGSDPTLLQLALYHLNTKLKDAVFWSCYLKRTDIKMLKIKNKFWYDTLSSWTDVNFHVPTSVQEVASQILWYNSHIRIAGEPVIFEEMADHGLLYIKDLFNDNGIMNVHQINELYNAEMTVMQYNLLITAIPREWKLMLKQSVDENEHHESLYQMLAKHDKWSPKTYEILNSHHDGLFQIMNSIEKAYGEEYTFEQIERICLSINRCTDVVKYRSFQYRILYNAVLCNNRLSKMGIVESDKCQWCKNCKETPKHLFVECEKAKEIWKDMSKYVRQTYNIDCSFRDLNVITSYFDLKDLTFLNLITIVVKQKLYASKFSKRNVNAKTVIMEIEFIHQNERKKAIATNRFKTYNKRWPDIMSNEDNKCCELDELISLL